MVILNVNIATNPKLVLLFLLVELSHGLALLGLGNVDVGLHGGVVGVAGPLHDDVGGDAHGEGVADKGAAAGVGSNDGVFGLGLLNALAVLVVDLGDGGVEAGQLGQLLQVVVHLLVADDGESGAAGEDHAFVLVQDSL